MNLDKTKILLVTAVVAGLAGVISIHAADLERHEQKELPAVAGGTLTFEAVVGEIEIKTHPKDLVRFESLVKPGGRRGSGLLDQLEYVYQAAEGNVKIAIKWKDGQQPRNISLNAHHTLVIPATFNIDASTAGGSITVQDLNGQVAAKTSGGRIVLGNLDGPVKVRTSGGSITLGNVHGNAEVNTSGGSINVGEVEGSVLAKTSGGAIRIRSVTGELKANTSGGSITAELLGPIENPVELRTSGGNVTLKVSSGFQADLDAKTSGGRVECDWPVVGTVRPNRVDGTVNGGGPKVLLRTSGGSIRVVKS